MPLASTDDKLEVVLIVQWENAVLVAALQVVTDKSRRSITTAAALLRRSSRAPSMGPKINFFSSFGQLA
jgi:hypothetical protein